jgi:hypothetical protein
MCYAKQLVTLYGLQMKNSPVMIPVHLVPGDMILEVFNDILLILSRHIIDWGITTAFNRMQNGMFMLTEVPEIPDAPAPAPAAAPVAPAAPEPDAPAVPPPVVPGHAAP